MKFGSKKSSQLIRLKGLDLVNLMACPHYDQEKSRRPTLKRMVGSYGGVAIALENGSAIEILDDTYRIVTSLKDAKAYRVFRDKGKVREEELPLDKQFRPLEELVA
jgi:dipeptidase E